MHVDHRVRLVAWDERMGWLVNHCNLFEVDPASEDLTRPIQIGSVANPDHRDFARGYEVASLECSGCFHTIDYFRTSHFQDGTRDVWLHPTLRLRHSADDQAEVRGDLLVSHEEQVRERHIELHSGIDHSNTSLLVQSDAGSEY